MHENKLRAIAALVEVVKK